MRGWTGPLLSDQSYGPAHEYIYLTNACCPPKTIVLKFSCNFKISALLGLATAFQRYFVARQSANLRFRLRGLNDHSQICFCQFFSENPSGIEYPGYKKVNIVLEF